MWNGDVGADEEEEEEAVAAQVQPVPPNIQRQHQR